MPTHVQIEGVGTVELDDAFKSKAPAEQEAIIGSIVSQHAAQSQPAPQGGDYFPPGDSRNSPAAVTVGSGPRGLPQLPPPKPGFMDKLGSYYNGVTQLPYDVLQSGMELGARGLDAVGVTDSAYPTLKTYFDGENNAPNPDFASDKMNPGNLGRTVGHVIGALPTLAINPFGSGSALAAAGNTALQGGAMAAQSANTSDSPIRDIGLNALGGGVFGGTLNLAGKGASRLIAPALPAADQALNYVRSLMTSSPTASTANGLRQAAASVGSKPIIAAEAIGRPAEVGIGALARRDGATADAFGGMLAARSSAAPQRILDDYASAAGVHPAAAQGNLDAFVAANESKASPLYKVAYDANQSIASPEIDRILSTPAGRQALKAAAENMQNDGALMGVRDPDLLEQAREAGQEIPWTGGVASGLKLRSLDYVKRAIDGKISMAIRQGDTAASGPLIGLKKRLVKALDDADVTAQAGPNSTKAAGGAYAQARAVAGDYLGAKEQFANGQDFILNPRVTAKQLADHVADLGHSDAEAFKGGIANRLFNDAQNGKLGPRIFNAPVVRQKLAAVIGPRNANAFLQNVATEARMATFAAKRGPGAGSPTAEYGAAFAEQDGPGSMLPAAVNFGLHAAQHGATSAAISTGANLLRQGAARYSTAGMSLPVRDAAGNLLMLHPADLAKVLDSTGATGLVGGAQLPRRALVANAVRGNIDHVARAGLLALPLLSSSPSK